jgi:hypothetical protein
MLDGLSACPSRAGDQRHDPVNEIRRDIIIEYVVYIPP